VIFESATGGAEAEVHPADEDHGHEDHGQPPEPPQRRHPLRDRQPPECYAVAQPAQGVNAAVAMTCSETHSALAQTIASPAARQWREAMDKGIPSLCAHCTWDLQEEPVGRKPFAS
jgi:hypothetical protein